MYWVFSHVLVDLYLFLMEDLSSSEFNEEEKEHFDEVYTRNSKNITEDVSSAFLSSDPATVLLSGVRIFQQ